MTEHRPRTLSDGVSAGQGDRAAGQAAYCVIEGMQALERQPWGDLPPPWAPGRREETAQMERAADFQDKTWCMSEVDIFCDLSDAEMDATAAAAPMKTYPGGYAHGK